MSLSKKTIPAFFSTVSLVSLIGLTHPVSLAQGGLASRLPDRWESSDFRPPRRIGSPSRTQGGGTRPTTPRPCVTQDQPVVVAPQTEQQGLRVGKTSQAYPVLFWYLPPTTAPRVEVALYDEEDQEIYSAYYTLANSSGGQIMHTPLPETLGIQPLAFDKIYRWEVTLVCDPMNRVFDINTIGYVQRVAVDSHLQANLDDSDGAERVVAAAGAKLWYDAIATLEQLRRASTSNPSELANIEAAWSRLLDLADLSRLNQLPIASTTP